MRVRFVMLAVCFHVKSICKPDWSSVAGCFQWHLVTAAGLTWWHQAKQSCIQHWVLLCLNSCWEKLCKLCTVLAWKVKCMCVWCVSVLLLHEGKLPEHSAGTEWGLHVLVCDTHTVVVMSQRKKVFWCPVFFFLTNKNQSSIQKISVLSNHTLGCKSLFVFNQIKIKKKKKEALVKTVLCMCTWSLKCRCRESMVVVMVKDKTFSVNNFFQIYQYKNWVAGEK